VNETERIAAWHRFWRSVDILEIQHAFERGIHDAALNERERCAQVAESFIPSGFTGDVGVARDDRARVIAHAIRNRKDESRWIP
jgi:hypothetical protein